MWDVNRTVSGQNEPLSVIARERPAQRPSAFLFVRTPLLLILAAPALAQDPLYVFDGDAAGDQLGFAVAGAGDVDGDGLADLVAGAPLEDAGGTWSGGARVWSGADGSLLHQLAGKAAGDRLGSAVAAAGDLDGDGAADLLLGAPYDELAGPGAGSAVAVAGAGAGLLLHVPGAAAGELFGSALTSVGDLDLDGVPDLAVGAPRSDGPGGTLPDAGRVAVLSGATGALLLEIYGDAPGDRLGTALASPGDVDQDGFPDLLVGLPLHDAAGLDAGAARLVSGADGSELLFVLGDSAGDRLGAAVGAAGLVNADGVPDLLIGAYLDDPGGSGSGSAAIYSGGDGVVLRQFQGNKTGEFLGFALGGGADANGDGRADPIIGGYGSAGAKGAVSIFSGDVGTPLLLAQGEAAGDFLGYAAAFAGDVNGDGLADYLAGAYGTAGAAGRVSVFRGDASPLLGTPQAISVSSGGVQNLILQADPAFANAPYWVLGTASGTAPGVPIDGLLLPLNPDAYTNFTLVCPSCPPLQGAFANLDGQGLGDAKVVLPAGTVSYTHLTLPTIYSV